MAKSFNPKKTAAVSKQVSILKRPNPSKNTDKKGGNKKKVRFDGIPSDLEDDNDLFEGQKDHIDFDGEGNDSEDSLFDEESVFDLPDEEEEDEDKN
jgi:hypothetical protein